jgi:holo-[acyl-carrier protein] synthase
MTILGIGTDMVAKSRIKVLIERFPEKFAARILSEDELKCFNLNKQTAVDYLAKRFAGKEAVAKALGTGIGEKVAFNEISITNLPSGKPQVTLLGKAQILITEFNIKAIHISLSDEKDFALAFAVVEKGVRPL